MRVVDSTTGSSLQLGVRAAEEYVTTVADELQRKGVAEVSTSVWEGAPVRAIVDAAMRERADVIVMSTHGRTGLLRLTLGSLAEAVVQNGTTPVLLLRPHAGIEHAPSGSAARLVTRSPAGPKTS